MIKALLFAMPDSVPRFDATAFGPNIAIASIAGNVDPGVCDVKVADLILVRRNLSSYVLGLLRKWSPDLVGLSCMSFQYCSAVRLAKLVKTYDENILVAMGGYHPTLAYEGISVSPESQFIDFIVRGEGEATFNELVTAINAGKGYEKIAGLSYKAGSVFHHNPPRALLPLDSIQLPNRDARLIKKGFHGFGRPGDASETSRGCTYNCKFCSIRHMYGRSFRTYELSRVIADVRDAYEHGATSVGFVDDNITLDLKRLEALCDEIVAAKLNSIHYVFQASVKGIAHSAKLAQKMADAGVRLVFLGIESVSKADLDFLGKKTTTSDDTRKAVKYLRDNGIISIGGFIVGNPDDDEESLWQVARVARDLKIDLPIFFILTPHIRTQIREELLARGLVTNPDEFSTYNGFSANVRTKYLAPEDVDRIVEEMYDAHFLNSDYIDFSLVRRIYPAYFWKKVAKQIPSTALDLTEKWLRKKGWLKPAGGGRFQRVSRKAW